MDGLLYVRSNDLFQFLAEYIEIGVYFTIGVEVLQSKTIRSIAAQLPADRILTETDNPSGWEWINGETGFPGLIESVESEVATIRGMSRETFSERLATNFAEVLRAGGVRV